MLDILYLKHMLDSLYLKHLLVGSALEGPAKRLRQRLSRRRWRKSPELLQLSLEETLLDLAVERFLTPDTNCVDIGCHLGSMLSLFTRRCPRGRHVAFEPTPRSFRWLGSKFPGADLRNLALSEEPGEMVFHVSRDSPGHSSLGSSGAQGRVDTIRVQVSTLDAELLDAEGVGFVKLDVEGAERSVLRGGRAFFAKHRPPVQFECGRNICAAFGYTPGDLHDAFTQELGYEVFSLQGALTRELPPLPREVMEYMQSYPWDAFNFMALPAERAESLRAAAAA